MTNRKGISPDEVVYYCESFLRRNRMVPNNNLGYVQEKVILCYVLLLKEGHTPHLKRRKDETHRHSTTPLDARTDFLSLSWTLSNLLSKRESSRLNVTSVIRLYQHLISGDCSYRRSKEKDIRTWLSLKSFKKQTSVATNAEI
ncbi:hypothetical protein TNCV_4763341 [Trichonephila clavipes]|nr:hypothetical protein TNCV_4763341 [Trichonephila clavipes]